MAHNIKGVQKTCKRFRHNPTLFLESPLFARTTSGRGAPRFWDKRESRQEGKLFANPLRSRELVLQECERQKNFNAPLEPQKTAP